MIGKDARVAETQHRKLSLLFREDGAVTVFSVIVLSSLLLFFSLLIDYARIAALHKLTEDAVRSSVRSVLSAYDSALYERYGLFGRGGTQGQTIFSEVMVANGEGAVGSNKKGIRMARTKLESTTLHASSYLGSHEVFARQVLEDMKYKAPVDFTLELVTKFAPMAGAMKEASVTLSLLESMRRLYEKREAHLAKVLELQERSASEMRDSGIHTLIPAQSAGASAAGSTVLSIASEFIAYAAKVKLQQELPAEPTSNTSKEIKAYEEKATALSIKLRGLSSEQLDQHMKRQRDAVRELEAARVLNDEMRKLAEEANQQQESTGYDTVSLANEEGAERYEVPAGTTDDIEQVKAAAADLVKSDEWFNEYTHELEAQGMAAAAIDAEAAEYQHKSLSSITRPIASSFSDVLFDRAASMRLVYERYEEKYIRPANVIERRKHEQSDLKAKLREQEEEAKSLWKQARSLLNGLTTVPQSEEHLQVFEQVKQRFSDNMLFNEQIEATVTDDAPMGKASDAHEAAEHSTAKMSSLFVGMAEMLERTRDSLYFGEYAVHRYSFFAPEHLRSMITGGDVSELGNAASFNNQETEYIIYGFHNSVGNIAAAYGELFAIRYAVRTMEGLIESRSLGHPLLILSAALIYGLEKTMEDMLAFAERGSAPLSKYVKVELSYKDYLRLFILMHGAGDKASMARMIAVIEQNNSVVLSAVPSGVTGEAHVSMELWFVPGLIRVIGKLGLLEGKVVGNRYETTQTIGGSY